MTRKDYVRIARGINLVYSEQGSRSGKLLVENIANTIAAELQDDNPRFDWERFADACTKEGE